MASHWIIGGGVAAVAVVAAVMLLVLPINGGGPLLSLTGSSAAPGSLGSSNCATGGVVSGCYAVCEKNWYGNNGFVLNDQSGVPVKAVYVYVSLPYDWFQPPSFTQDYPNWPGGTITWSAPIVQSFDYYPAWANQTTYFAEYVGTVTGTPSSNAVGINENPGPGYPGPFNEFCLGVVLLNTHYTGQDTGITPSPRSNGFSGTGPGRAVSMELHASTDNDVFITAAFLRSQDTSTRAGFASTGTYECGVSGSGCFEKWTPTNEGTVQVSTSGPDGFYQLTIFVGDQQYSGSPYDDQVAIGTVSNGAALWEGAMISNMNIGGGTT
jgi:hypothetical protein